MRIKFKLEPKVGDQRTVTKFLWFPKYIENEIRWLEKSTFTQEYTIGGLLEPCYWFSIKWVD